MNHIGDNKLLFRNDVATPLGRLAFGGYAHKRDRSEMKKMRVLGSYALVYLLAGGGHYRDVNGFSQAVRAGDSMLVFPELAHRYGPTLGEKWSEIYVVFDGPAFDLWRAQGVLNPSKPVAHHAPVAHWRARLESVLAISHTAESVAAFLNLLTQMLAPQMESVEKEELWLARARRMMEENLSAPLDLKLMAREVGMSQESFRKRFNVQTGVPPARYRAQKRIEAAQVLLLQTNLTLRAVADSLGFADEFHFSRRFKQLTGKTPRAFRHDLSEKT